MELSMKSGTQVIQYRQYHAGKWDIIDSGIIVESEVSLTVNGEVWMAFMCTPTELEALAVGFLYNEGLIDSVNEIANVHVCEHGDNVDIWTTHAVEKPKTWRRTSGCTGGVTAVEEESTPPINLNGFSIAPREINLLIGELFESQDLYRKVGGVHTSALSDGKNIHVTAEDIGRHNSIDKLAGIYLLNQIDVPNKIILTTGRISSEMLQKAARLGAAIVISRTSPSSLSIELAEKLGVTLIGYARRDRFSVYAHPERISSERILDDVSRSSA
jgi:FdhD protein